MYLRIGLVAVVSLGVISAVSPISFISAQELEGQLNVNANVAANAVAYDITGPIETDALIRLLVQSRAVTDRTLRDEVVVGRVTAVAPDLRLIVIENSYEGKMQLRLLEEPLVVRNGEMGAYADIAPGDWVILAGAGAAVRAGTFKGFQDNNVLLEVNGAQKSFELSNFAQYYNEGISARSYQLPMGEDAVVLVQGGRVQFVETGQDIALASSGGFSNLASGALANTRPVDPLLDIAPLAALALAALGAYMLFQYHMQKNGGNFGEKFEIPTSVHAVRAWSESLIRISFVGARSLKSFASIAIHRTAQVLSLYINRVRELFSRTADVR